MGLQFSLFGFVLSVIVSLSVINTATGQYNDGYIQYSPVKLSPEEKQTVGTSLKSVHELYDPEGKMITSTLNGYNYHTDAQSGVFHDVRSSFWYAISLLDLDDGHYTKRAFDIIDKTISLQDQDPGSKTYGVWPYYMEEPLATKKAPVDYNWADFNAVSLLDAWMGHQEQIPAKLKEKIKNSLILAAKSIQKRNVKNDYTNIAIMGTYVTYMVSHLFNLPEMQEYAQTRLRFFYEYTLEKGGFSEYNSPTYTIVALDELSRMKLHIIEPGAKTIIDSLYYIGWEMIARHYHQPSGQWAGPHSRSYSTLVRPSFYTILNEAAKIRIGVEKKRTDVKVKHHIPGGLMHYFLAPEYPRTEIDVFEKVEPQIIGTTYLTDKYALSTANLSSFWNQRRPFLAYWGKPQDSKYLQVRFLHDSYDFTAANFYSQQDENNVLAVINFSTNGGDKHPHFDRLTDGKFKAKDLRLRFEFGNVKTDELSLPISNNILKMDIDNLGFNIQLCKSTFGQFKGHWEKRGDGKASWIDFVIYSGPECDIDLSLVTEAILVFTFSIGSQKDYFSFAKPKFIIKDGILNAKWGGLILNTRTKPSPRVGWIY